MGRRCAERPRSNPIRGGFSALKGHDKTAQGNALGYGTPRIPSPVRARQPRVQPAVLLPIKTHDSFASIPEGSQPLAGG